jgi:hypothetical protein
MKSLMLTAIALILALCLLSAAPSRADSIATLDLSATLVTTNDQYVANGDDLPSLFVTGQIFYDITTATVLGTGLSFLGLEGANHQFSSQGQDISGFCDYIQCQFSAGDGVASLSIVSGYFVGGPSFVVGNDFGVCPISDTLYGSLDVHSIPCSAGSAASFDNIDGVVYSLPDGGSTGSLTVAAIPEPSILILLLTGCVFFALVARWRDEGALSVWPAPPESPVSAPVAHLARRAARSLQPLRKIHQPHLVLDAHVRHRHLNNVHPLRDSCDPLMTADRRDSLRDGLIERGRRDLDAVRDSVEVLNRHPARFGRHDGKITNSLCVRYQVWALHQII